MSRKPSGNSTDLIDRIRNLPGDANLSLAERVAALPAKKRRAILAKFTDDELDALRWDWRYRGRPSQQEPLGDWYGWLVLAGRGAGKTRTGAQWIHQRAMSGDERREMCLISKTPADARDDMIEGLGGIMRNVPPDERPTYEPSNRRLVWPSGARARVRSGAHPDEARGFTGDTAWLDEIAAWQYPKETWDNLTLGMRESRISEPRVLITTTPRPIPLVKNIKKRCDDRPDQWRLTIESTYANRANLSPAFYEEVIAPLEGTDLGRQEIHAAILEEVQGALWRRDWIEATRMSHADPLPDLNETVVAIDPAVTATEDSNETGIIVATRGRNRHGYMLADLSGRHTAEAWARIAVEAYYHYSANSIVAEKNQGGDLITRSIHAYDPDVPVRLVHSGKKGKRLRAEPVALKAEQLLIHHVGSFPELEDQLCTWVPGDADSPDRMDAYVYAFLKLLITGQSAMRRLEVVSIGQDNPFRIE